MKRSSIKVVFITLGYYLSVIRSALFPLVVLIFPIVVLVYPLAELVFSRVASACPLVVLDW